MRHDEGPRAPAEQHGTEDQFLVQARAKRRDHVVEVAVALHRAHADGLLQRDHGGSDEHHHQRHVFVDEQRLGQLFGELQPTVPIVFGLGLGNMDGDEAMSGAVWRGSYPLQPTMPP